MGSQWHPDDVDVGTEDENDEGEVVGDVVEMVPSQGCSKEQQPDHIQRGSTQPVDEEEHTLPKF